MLKVHTALTPTFVPHAGKPITDVQLTLNGNVLAAMPTPPVDDCWFESYAKALISGEMHVNFDPEPSADLAQGMQEWAQMRLEGGESVKGAAAIQQRLENAAEEEKIAFGPLSDYCIAKLTADKMKEQQMNLAERVAEDGSTSDSFLEPPNGDDVDIDMQQDLDEGANMERYHYVNPYQDRDDAESTLLENLAGSAMDLPPAEIPEGAPAGSSTDKCIDSCKSETGRLLLMQGAVNFRTQASSHINLSSVVPCPNHKFKRWVIALIPNATIDTEEGFKELVAREGFDACPFFVGCSGVDNANEMCIIYQSSEADKHKVKALGLEGVCLQTFKKGGGQSQKIIETISTLRKGCKAFLTNLDVRAAEHTANDDMSYEQALETVEDWGVDRLTAFVENAKIKRSRDKALSGLEYVCLISKASLMEVVKLRQDAGEFVFYLGGDRQRRDCPKTFADGATEYAKNLKVYVWNPSSKQFDTMTLQAWLESDEHLLTALLLLGEGGKGKSKLSHMLAQDLTVGYAKELYVLAKAVDPLGILSHTGVFKKAGALIIADADFKTTKGPMSAEEVKSVFDIQEGGTIQGTRYRPANFAGGGELPRIFNMNASPADMGKFFRKHDMHGIAMVLEAIAGDKLQKAAEQLQTLDAVTQAQVRRFAIALCMKEESLVTEDTIATLRANTKERALAAKRRRENYYSA